MRIFVCHSTLDSEFVIQVASLLRPNCEEVFYYESQQRANEDFQATIDMALQRCDCFLVFVGQRFSQWQRAEAATAAQRNVPNICTIYIQQKDGNYPETPAGLGMFAGRPQVMANPNAADTTAHTAVTIMHTFNIPCVLDGLPFNPNLFSYEKDIIDSYTRMIALGKQASPLLASPGLEDDPQKISCSKEKSEIRQKLLDGCPAEWPKVPYWVKDGVSAPPDASYVVAAALSKHHEPIESNCMVRNELFFPEARTRTTSRSSNPGQAVPLRYGVLNVAILVAGGIAPGINAVIDGIVQRHSLDARERKYKVDIFGIRME